MVAEKSDRHKKADSCCEGIKEMMEKCCSGKDGNEPSCFAMMKEMMTNRKDDGDGNSDKRPKG